MNQTNQIHTAEHNLKQIDGHTIVASKKKRKTCAKSSTDSPSSEPYTLPQTFEQFCKQLETACEGDRDSKSAISELTPEIEKSLKEWDNPNIPISPPPPHSNLLKTLESGQVSTPKSYSADEIDSVISSILGPIHTTESVDTSSSVHSMPADIEQAYGNFVTDVSLDSDDNSSITCTTKEVSKLLTGMQPFRERPSKDRWKRFATGDLPFDKQIPCHQILVLESAS